MDRVKRALVIAASLVALLAGVTTAEAVIAKGKFAGKTKRGEPLGFRVDKSNRVYSFYFQDVRLDCTDGDHFFTPGPKNPSDPDPSQQGEEGEGQTIVRTPKSERFAISSSNKWGFTARNNDVGNGYDVSGKFSSQDKSKGTFSIFANFDEGNEGDPSGEVKCSSGKLSFTVKRK